MAYRGGASARVLARLFSSQGHLSAECGLPRSVQEIISPHIASPSNCGSSFSQSRLLSLTSRETCAHIAPHTIRPYASWPPLASTPLLAYSLSRRSWASYAGQSQPLESATSSSPGKPKVGRYQDKEVVVRNLQGEECGKVTLPGTVFDVPVRKDIIHSVIKWQLAKRRSGTHSTLAVGEVRGTSKKPFQQKGSGRARQGTLRGPHFRGGATMHGPKPRSYFYPLQKKVRRLGLRIALSSRLAEGKLAVFDDLEPETHKTKDMAKLLATAFPDSKKLLLIDQLHMDQVIAAQKKPPAPSSTEPQASTEGHEDAEGKTPEDPITEELQTSLTTAAPSELSGEPSSAPAGVLSAYRPLTKAEILALKQAEKVKQLPAQKVSGKLLRATNNLHHVNVLPTLGLNVYSILQHDTLVLSRAALQGTIQRLHTKILSRRERRHIALQAAREKRTRGEQSSGVAVE